MESAEIARRFLTYFEQRGHTVVPSASLVSEDPTLLFVVAGMVPFLPYLLGQRKPPYNRAASVQKCLRTADIEEVGKTTRHGTFFQMLGSWSFGDYFKEEAITWAWDLLTRAERDGGFGFAEDRLWATVYLDDDEAYGIWRDKVGLPESRIQRLGKEHNYWDMGVPGPCGPDSEIYYDRGPDYGREGGPAVNEERYLEIWNLVFMQYQRGPGQGVDYEITGDLPAKNIDTGMGLERMAAILQGVDNLFEIDTTWKVLDRAAELTEQKYGRDRRSDVALRVVADHVDSAVMLVADGVLPSNEGARLRAAPRCCAAASATCGCWPAASAAAPRRRFLHELTRHGHRGARPAVPEPAQGRGEHPDGDRRRGGGVPRHAAHRQRDLRRRGGGGQAPRLGRARRRAGVPAARHLRLPDRPDPGDGGRAGAEGRRGRLPAADDRAAGAGQARTPQEKKTGNADVSVFAGAARAVRPASTSPATTRSPARRRSSACWWTASASRPRGRAPRSASCSTGPRSTPRAAASSPTPASSGWRPPTAPTRWPRSTTCRRRCPGVIVHHSRVRSGEIVARLARLRGDRHRAAPRGLPVAHRHPPAAPRVPRRARRVGRAGGLGERARPAAVRLHRRAARCRSRCSGTSRTRSTRCSSPTSTSGRSTPRSTTRARWARWRCSARSTATRSGWSRSATTPASCAAARTWPGPGSSA